MHKLKKILNGAKYLLRIFKLNSKLLVKNFFNFKNNDVFAAFIDLNAFAPNFNYSEYLLYIKHLSLNKNLFLIVLPREQFSKINTKEKKDYFFELRIKTILKPLIEMILNKHGTIIYAKNRKDMKLFFELPDRNKFPNDISLNKVSFTAIKSKNLYELFKKENQKFNFDINEDLKLFIKANYLKNLSKKLITISIKYNSYRPHLNSNIEEWKIFGKWLKQRGYDVIYIVDIENQENILKLNTPEFYTLATISSFDLEIRKALYDLSNLNFSTSGGSAQLLFYSNNNYVITKFISIEDKDAVGTGSLKNIQDELGFSQNQQFPFSLKTQKILWDPKSENFSTLKDTFYEIESLI